MALGQQQIQHGRRHSDFSSALKLVTSSSVLYNITGGGPYSYLVILTAVTQLYSQLQSTACVLETTF